MPRRKLSLSWVSLAIFSGVAGLSACIAHSVASSAGEQTQASSEREEWLVEDFEAAQGRSGYIHLEVDKNELGTQVDDLPFKVSEGGSQKSPRGAGRVKGTLGENRAPYSWVQLQLHLGDAGTPKDLRKFKSLRFMVRGDGGRYKVALTKKAVSDFDHFQFTFNAPATWSEVRVPIAAFTQAGWGKPVPNVFDDVTMIQFSPAEHDKPFEFAIDDVTLSTDEIVLAPIAYDTKDWIVYRGTEVTKRRGTALDVSRLLDAPAGKHGGVVRKGDGLAFENGKPARFIGVNIVASANFPTHEQADRVAELLAHMGVNLTRHHHMDADWAKPNIWDNAPNTLALGKEALERFDYFIAALQKRGIYQFVDLVVHRKPFAADGIEAPEDVVPGYKIEGEFAPRLIALQEQFATQLFSHENPYTKKRYGRDPAFAMLEIINEDSLFFLQKDGDFAIKSPHYQTELNRQFGKWLGNKYRTRVELEKRWGDGPGQGLLAHEDPSKGTVNAVVPFDDSLAKLTKPRAEDTIRFFYDTMAAYYRRMEQVVRKLGYRGLVTGSNHWVEMPVDLRLNAEFDYIDRHAYWSHPNGGWGYDSRISFDPSAMVRDANLGMVGALARRRVHGMPYTVSEWQCSAPNDYRAEGLLIMGAVSTFQGWHPIQFAFSHDFDKNPERPRSLDSNFDIVHEPNMLALWPGIALMFHRRDVAEANRPGFLKVDEKAVWDPTSRLEFVSGSPLVLKTGVDFKGGEKPSELEQLVKAHVNNGRVTAPNAELTHDAARGQFVVNTARTQGFAGMKAKSAIETKNVQLSFQNEFAVVLVSALVDAPIAEAKRVLVTAVGNAVNTGQKLDFSRGRLADPGSAPILAEPIRATIKLHHLAGDLARAKVYALNGSGERVKELAITHSATDIAFTLEPKHQALNYEIVRE